MDRLGCVYLVGAGPGDPGLMTLKGRELLSLCDVVVYDHLASERFLDWVPENCRKIYVGKQAGHHSMKQEEINGILVELALSGRTVVRLKGGDPFVFGRGGEEVLALEKHGIPYETVPGVTSAVAVPESAGIPVTHRAVSRSFHVITGHTQAGTECLPPDFGVYGTLPGTLVFLMGLGQLPKIVQQLIDSGKSPDTPAAVIENGTLPGERVIRAPLAQISSRVREAGLGTPAVIVVGDTAAYEMKYRTEGPLAGKRVGITGTEQFAGKLAAALSEQGAQVSWLINMKVEDHIDEAPMQTAYRNLSDYTWLVFTSANGVRLFFQGLFKDGRDYRCLGHVKFAVIGDGTGRELAGYGFNADYMPDTYCAKALADGLVQVAGPGDRLLIARSGGGSPVLAQTLLDAGIRFDDIVLYEVSGRQASSFRPEQEMRLDYITFASASGVRAFFDCMDKAGTGDTANKALGPAGSLKDIRLVCIGAVTAHELERQGYRADITAGQYHIEGLVQAIIKDSFV